MILRDFMKMDRIILEWCDVETYLEAMEYGVSFGKSLKFKGYQGTVFSLMQQKLGTALIASRKLEESRQFLEEGWTGKKNTRLYKLTVMNLDLAEAYYYSDTARFNDLFQTAAPVFKKDKFFVAEQMFLEQKYEQAAAFLKTYKTKNAYNEVLKQYLMGQCYDKIGNRQMAEDCMQYAADYGNTMPCQKKAREWLMNKDMPERLESKTID